MKVTYMIRTLCECGNSYEVEVPGGAFIIGLGVCQDCKDGLAQMEADKMYADVVDYLENNCIGRPLTFLPGDKVTLSNGDTVTFNYTLTFN